MEESHLDTNEQADRQLERRLLAVEQENKRLLETQVRLGEVTNNYLMLHYLNKSVHNCRTTQKLWETYMRNITDKGFNYKWVWVLLPGETAEFDTKIYLDDGHIAQEMIEFNDVPEFVRQAVVSGTSQTSDDNTTAAVPIVNNYGMVKGVLVTEKRYGITFEDLEILDVYAQQTVSTIENVTLNEKLIYFQDLLGKRLDLFVLLHYVSKEIHDTLDYYGVLERYLRISRSPMGLGFKNSAMYIVGENGLEKAILTDDRLVIEAPVPITAVDELVRRAKQDGCYQLDGTQRRLAFPLLADDRVFAIMEIEDDKVITDEQLQIFQIFAVQTSSVLDNRRLRLRLEEMVEERTQELQGAYDQLNYWNQSLEKRVGERTGDLQMAVNRLEAEILERQQLEWTVMKRTEELAAKNAELSAAFTELQAAKAAVEDSHYLLEKANAKLLKISMMDGLTEVANRRRFNQVLEEEWQRAGETKREISLIMLDVDFFKSYNDTYGHLAGDQILRLVAATMESVAGDQEGLVARYGGEEFVILLPNRGWESARALAEKLRRAVEKLQIEHQESLVGPYLTVSLGVHSRVPDAGNLPGVLISEADAALYRAKQEGRNRVIVIV